MFSWRLALALGDARYSDLVERTLFNVVATSPSTSGTTFYYANTLHQRTPGTPATADAVSPRAESSLRAPWFEVSCCPPNIARTLASMDALIATVDTDGLQIHQYAASTIRTRLPGGEAASFDIDTDYPRSGAIRITAPTSSEQPITLSLRIPHWVDVAELRVRSAGQVVTSDVVQPGWATVRRTFRAGDCVELDLPMEPRVVHPDSRIDSVRGCVAVERGPEVFCLESVDLAAASGGAADDVADIRLDTSAPIIAKDGALVVRVSVVRDEERIWPYADLDLDPNPGPALEVPLIPYHNWAERGPSTMRVWLPFHPHV